MQVSPQKAARIRIKEVDLPEPMRTPIEVYPAVVPKYLPLALNHALADRTMSRAAMADVFNIDRSYLTRIFHGEKIPTMHSLAHMMSVEVGGEPFFTEHEKVAVGVGTLIDAGVISDVQGDKIMRIMSIISN